MEKQTKGEITRSNILRTAHQLFIRQGYHGTSMRQIAEEANIALGAIYNHYAGKEDLFKSVFLQNHPYHDILPALLESHGENPETLVRDMAGKMVLALENRPDFLNLLFIELVEFNSIHAMELYQSIMPQVRDLLDHFLSAGHDKIREIPPFTLARVFIGLFFSYHLTGKILQPLNGFPVGLYEDAMPTFVEIFLHGILRE